MITTWRIALSLGGVEEHSHAGAPVYPYMFTWMIHVFPYEDNLKARRQDLGQGDVFSMNDDVAHVH